MKRLTLLLVAIGSMWMWQARADEGMWLPFLIDDALYGEMRAMGLNISPEEIFSLRGEASIKDAIVSFGGFCTGEMISDRGLVLTNHHCGYGRIQAHSSVENDLLSDGFWAMSLEEELPNEGLFVRFLVDVVDVTQEVSAALGDDMGEEERREAIREISQELTAAATSDTHYTANVSAMFAGNHFYLFTYETFNDVRLVGAPPNDIGAFGGDTDNWEWPRHTGDFALFRVYTAPDGTPAEYHEDNVPLRPRHHLPISARGVKEDDFAMILGYSGRTERYLTSHAIEYRLEHMYPVRIDIRRKKLDIIEEAMAQSDELRIKYASKHSGIANYWKNFIGMSESLQRLGVADEKREKERQFSQWAHADPQRQAEYGFVMEDFRRVYEGMRQFNSQTYVFIESMATGPDAIRVANAFSTLNTLLEEEGDREDVVREAERLGGIVERLYRNYDKDVDQALWAAMFEVYHGYVPQESLPGVFEEIAGRHGNDFAAWAEEVYGASIFAEASRLEAFLEAPDHATLANDPVFVAAQSVYGKHREISEAMGEYNTLLQRTDRFFQRGLMEMMPERPFYPDANGTMRFTYGRVGGYHPMDAVYYDYFTTLSGVMEKEDPGHHEFVVAEKLKALYEDGDFGDYATDGVMVVNFITNNDITGGNSGSPVINADGHLIGVAFDANWEGMSGDILFEHEMQRCINVDARYMLFIIDRFAGAGHLLEEMTIVY